MSVGLTSFADCVDLACAGLGGAALWATDDFFASKDHLVADAEPVFDPHAYVDTGKLMDGWESRRKRVPGHDRCVVRLGVPGVVRGFDVDTSWFMGNQPPFCRIEGCVAPPDSDGEALDASAPWVEILPEVPLGAGRHNLFAASRVDRWTHLRLHILPDGGVARLRVYGAPAPTLVRGTEIDVAALASGGRAIAASDNFYGDANNVLRPGRAVNMGGGWETRRRRDTAHDWVIVRLAGRSTLRRIVLDTHHNKGNYPDRGSIFGLDDANAGPYRIERRDDWVPVVLEHKLEADTAHTFEGDAIVASGPFTHVRMRVDPDGGVSRLRVYGVVDHALDLAGRINQGGAELDDALLRCCGCAGWVAGLRAAAPFVDTTGVLLAADEVWWGLSPDQWRQAFAHHPRIGDDPARLRARFTATAGWAGGEQAGVQGAAEDTLAALQTGNREYEARFGHVFLVCATGLSADQMLAALRRRLRNPPDVELRIAAGEQARITRLRLHKLEGSP